MRFLTWESLSIKCYCNQDHTIWHKNVNPKFSELFPEIRSIGNYFNYNGLFCLTKEKILSGQLVFRRYNPIHTFQSQRILHAFETLQMKKQYRTKNSTGFYKSLFGIFWFMAFPSSTHSLSFVNQNLINLYIALYMWSVS